MPSSLESVFRGESQDPSSGNGNSSPSDTPKTAANLSMVMSPYLRDEDDEGEDDFVPSTQRMQSANFLVGTTSQMQTGVCIPN